MRKIAIALLATTMLASPAAFAASNNNQQQPQGQQTQQNQNQNGQQNAQNKRAPQKGQQQQSAQNNQQQSAQNNQPISPQNLSHGQVRRVQQALDKDGFKAGRTDGRWGNETQNAVKQFQQSKQLQATGQLNQQTVADLGLDTSRFSQSQSQRK